MFMAEGERFEMDLYARFIFSHAFNRLDFNFPSFREHS